VGFVPCVNCTPTALTPGQINTRSTLCRSDPLAGRVGSTLCQRAPLGPRWQCEVLAPPTTGATMLAIGHGCVPPGGHSQTAIQPPAEPHGSLAARTEAPDPSRGLALPALIQGRPPDRMTDLWAPRALPHGNPVVSRTFSLNRSADPPTPHLPLHRGWLRGRGASGLREGRHPPAQPHSCGGVSPLPWDCCARPHGRSENRP